MTSNPVEEDYRNTIRFNNEAKIEEFEQKWLNGLVAESSTNVLNRANCYRLDDSSQW